MVGVAGVLPHDVPQVLINREHLGHMTFDVELLGYSDDIVSELCRRLGADWLSDVAGQSTEQGAGQWVWPKSIRWVHGSPFQW